MLPKAHYAKRLTAVLAILCIFRIAAPGQTTNNEPIPPPPIGKLVDVGGYRVHLYCTGSGSPAVVIVGAGYSFDWGLVQPEVAILLRCVHMTIPALAGATARKIHALLG